MKKAGQYAAEMMKQCVHLLDKYPVPLSTIADVSIYLLPRWYGLFLKV